MENCDPLLGVNGLNLKTIYCLTESIAYVARHFGSPSNIITLPEILNFFIPTFNPQKKTAKIK